MLSYRDTKDALRIRLVEFTVEEYLYALQIVLGEEERVAYASVYDPDNFDKNVPSEDEEEYLETFAESARELAESQQCVQLISYLRDEYNRAIQEGASNLSDFKFSQADVMKLLNNLLHERSQVLSEASVKDLLSIIRSLEESGALGGDDNFSQHFITVQKHYDALCPACGHELYAVEGLDIRCPHCKQLYKWDNNRFYPSFEKL